MSISMKQYLELPKGAVLAMNKDSFVVSGFIDEMELREPVLVNRQTGERLSGAIYITHLLRIESLPDGCELPANDVCVQTEQASPLLDEMTLSIQELGEPSDLFYCSEVMTGWVQNPGLTDYQSTQHQLLLG